MDDKGVSETHLYSRNISNLRPTKVTVQMEAKHETIYLVSNLYGSRKRGATVSKYKLIEFITVCAAEKGSDSMVTLHSPFQLLSFFPRIFFFTLSRVCVFSLPWNRFVTFSNDLMIYKTVTDRRVVTTQHTDSSVSVFRQFRVDETMVR